MNSTNTIFVNGVTRIPVTLHEEMECYDKLGVMARNALNTVRFKFSAKHIYDWCVTHKLNPNDVLVDSYVMGIIYSKDNKIIENG